MLWLTGGSQEDIAQLTRLEVHVKANMLVYQRQKLQGKGETYGMARIVIGPALQALLDRLPPVGYLFPRISREKPQHRSTEFTRRCHIVGVKDRSLHGYRYGWAERACSAGMPERDAMTHLGHKSSGVHRAYALKANAPILPWNITRKSGSALSIRKALHPRETPQFNRMKEPQEYCDPHKAASENPYFPKYLLNIATLP